MNGEMLEGACEGLFLSLTLCELSKLDEFDKF